MCLFLRPLWNLKISTPVRNKELVTIMDKLICLGIVQKTARTLQSKLRSVTITIDFLNWEEDGNKCSNGRQHKLQSCNKWDCKATRHSENRPTSISPSSAPSDEVSSLRQQLVVLSTPLKKIEVRCSENPSYSTHVVSSNQALTLSPRRGSPLTSKIVWC